MTEYISKEYMRYIVQEYWDRACGCGELFAYGNILDEIDDAPVEDVVQAKYGQWHLAYGSDGLVCSYCGQNVKFAEKRFDYCPNCGAYMRETYGDKND